MSPSISSQISTASSNGKYPLRNSVKLKEQNVARTKRSILKHKQDLLTRPTMRILVIMTKTLSTSSILRAKPLKEGS